MFWLTKEAEQMLKTFLAKLRLKLASLENSMTVWAKIEDKLSELLLLELEEDNRGLSLDHIRLLVEQSHQHINIDKWTEHLRKEDDREKRVEKLTTAVQKRPLRKDRQGPVLALDPANGVIGGVASGIGRYVGFSPVWLRLLFILSFYDLFGVPEITVTVVSLYCILWVWLYSSKRVSYEDPIYSHIYREPVNRWAGGVAKGLSAYGGIPVWAVRLIFLVMTFIGGIGLVAYLTFWAFLSGKPPDQTWDSLYGHHDFKQRKLAIRVNQNPIWWIKQLFSIFKYAFALIAFFVSLFVISVFTALVIYYTLNLGEGFSYDGIIISGLIKGLLQEVFPVYIALLTYVAAVVPFVIVALLAISSLFKRLKMAGSLYILLVSCWMVSMVGLGIYFPSLLNKFSEKSYDLKSQKHTYNMRKAIDIELVATTDNFLAIASIKIIGHDGESLEIHRKATALGKERNEAKRNAKATEYIYTFEDNRLTLNSSFQIMPENPYRFQTMIVGVNIPFGQPFTVSDGLLDKIVTGKSQRFNWDEISLDEAIWYFNTNGELECLEGCK